MTPGTDVLIVGGGIIGLAIGYESARAGLSVRLFEKGEPGCEASSASAGMLGAQLDTERDDPNFRLDLASRHLYPAFIRRVTEQGGIDPDYRTAGSLVIARTPDDQRRLDRCMAFQQGQGLRAERLDGAGLRRMEPAITSDASGAIFLPDDGSVDGARLTRGLRLAAERAGVVVQPGSEVGRLLTRGGRTVGVEAAGVIFEAGAVVIAAGAWSGAIGGDGLQPPATHPVRGQIVCRAAPSPLLRHTLIGSGFYVVPRSDGRHLIGSTMERVGFDRRVTDEAVASLNASATSLAPCLADAPQQASWAGLRPSTDDGLPAIGPGPIPGLYYACGHLRHGILQAPITARIMVRLLRGDDPGIDVTAFDPRRFARCAERTGS